MSKSTFVCVPGAWHSPEAYTQVVKILREHGYPAVGLALPSVGADPAHQDFLGDVKTIRDCLTQLVVHEEKNVILVMHSYSGVPGTEAPFGLGRTEREKMGLKGGVERLVYIMAYAMPEGSQPATKDAPFPDWMRVDREKGVVNVGSEDARRIFYNDLSPEKGDEWAAKLKHQSAGVFFSTTSYAAWRYIPSTYVVGTNDKTNFSPGFVEMMIQGARAQEPSAFDVVEECDAGHSLMLSRPGWLGNVLRRAAGEI